MERVNLQVETRENAGKSPSKKLRRAGMVPAVLYKRGEKTQHVSVDARTLDKILRKEGENVLLNVTFKGDKKPKERVTMIKEVQVHPISGNLLHVDFNEISLTEKIKVNVPVEAKGEAIGVTRDKGVLEHIMWELEVECLPTQIPDNFEVDVAAMEIGHAVFVKDIPPPPGVEILNDLELTVFTVKPPHEIEEAAPVEEGAEEGVEPEVIAKGKKEEEGVPEGEAEKAPAKEEKKKD